MLVVILMGDEEAYFGASSSMPVACSNCGGVSIRGDIQHFDRYLSIIRNDQTFVAIVLGSSIQHDFRPLLHK